MAVKFFGPPKCWKRLEHGAGLSGSLSPPLMPTMLTAANDVYELCSIPLATIRLDTNFESLENLMMLYTVRKVLASLVEFTNVDDVASCVTQQHMIFVMKRVLAKIAVDRVW